MTPDHIPSNDAPLSAAWTRRVLIVDDHARTRGAVAALLQEEYPRIDVVGTAGDGNTALRQLRDAAPHVVLLDLDLGDEHGLDLMPAISRHPGVAVVILSSSDDPLERIRALGAGAVAFVSKLSPAADLIAAILAVRPSWIDTGVLSYAAGSADPCK